MSAEKSSIGIAVLGFGTVGQGVAEIFQIKKAELEKCCAKKLNIIGVALRDRHKPRAISMPENLITTNPLALVEQENVDIVLELMGGVATARQCILRALDLGKPVVTANKALLAECGEEIFTTAKKNGQPLGYEASVAAGLPIIKILRDGLASTEISEISGILNGTTNFILSQMQEKGQSYEEAFTTADELGYLEADPALDVDGWDAAHKLVILSSIAFKRYVSLNEIEREGIAKITPENLAQAKNEGKTIKLVASLRKEKGEFKLRVRPEALDKSHPLANVGGGLSGVVVRGDFIGEAFFLGPGAGALPTASAVVSDLIAILRDAERSGFGF
ncbi:MAG: homoserine dehydrogenase [Calditrichaeota bacterium]|nr:MAG: homoserine dehydrogenase [Calditrichota bacterium]